MAKFSIVIVDDVAAEAEAIKALLMGIDEVGEIKVFSNAMEAVRFLKANLVDILYLDIEMPGLSGLDLYGSLPVERRPALILVTAHKEFAHDGFQLDAADFILKPVDYKHIALSLVKAVRKLQLPMTIHTHIEPEYAFFPLRGGGYKLFSFKDIIYLEVVKNYIRIVERNGEYHIRGTMKQLETEMPTSHFIRIHQSYMVNLYFVNLYNYNKLSLNDDKGTELVVSRAYRANVQHMIIGRQDNQ